jgi:anti-sigma B factor antagonist
VDEMAPEALGETATLHIVGRTPVVVAAMTGEIDLANADTGEERLVAGVPSEADSLVLDLSAVTYLDSAGIRLILGVNERLHLRRQELRLVVPATAPIQRLIEITRLGLQVPIFATVSEAESASSR